MIARNKSRKLKIDQDKHGVIEIESSSTTYGILVDTVKLLPNLRLGDLRKKLEVALKRYRVRYQIFSKYHTYLIQISKHQFVNLLRSLFDFKCISVIDLDRNIYYGN
jgi:hypothetical protein